MNDAGKKRAEQLAQKEYTLIEYRNKLVRMQNMDCICHCSAEIDMGTLLYFSVNDLFLGQGCYVVLLFSEVSEPTPDQSTGHDVFGRMFTYAIIEEIAQEVFTGHYSFFSSELDGRLVLILSFPFGLLPDRSIVSFLDQNCIEISNRCRERYDMNVITYISSPIENIRYLTAIFTKLLEMASLHRYARRGFDSPVFQVPLPVPTQWGAQHASVQDSANTLVTALVSGGDYHALADRILQGFADGENGGIDNLKRKFGDCFELICLSAAQMGIKLQVGSLREEQFRILFDSVCWDEPVMWMHRFLDKLYESYSETVRKTIQLQYDRAISHIDSSLSDPALTVERCAVAAGCSTSALGKIFRRLQDTSVAKYIREKRLEQALALLRSGCTVGETGLRCGFGSAETFHRAFKAKYGVTPGQVRGLEQPQP